MNSFRELLAAMMPDGDYNAEVFRLSCGSRELTARDGEGNAVLEVLDGECSARREYSYDEAYKALSALRDGSARLAAWFPPVQKSKYKPHGISFGRLVGILFGLALALFSGFCGFAVLMSNLFSPSEYGTLFNISLEILLFGWLSAGVALVVTSAEGSLTTRRFFGVGGGFVMFTTLLALILGVWSTRADDPVTPLSDYIGMTVTFGLLAALGAGLMIYTMLTDSSSSSYGGMSYGRQPSFRVEPSAAALAPVIAAIKERTACEAIRIRLDFDRQPSLSDSKLGGLPYWDTTMAYPCDENSGDKLAMLAQINLSQLPENDFFPREGMLQFFIRPDIEYGLSSTQKVIFHRTVNRSVFAKEIKELGLPDPETEEYGDFPVTGEIAMNFEKVTTYMTESDGRFDRLLHETAAQMGVELFDGASYEVIEEAAGDNFSEEGTGHIIGGYPYFTQYDPRNEEALEKYDFLLLQLDTDDKVGRHDKAVMWGDAGVGQFSINRETLRSMNLSDIYYNWDCC